MLSHVSCFVCIEVQYAVEKKKEIVPLRMVAGYEPDGWVGLLCAGKLYFDFSDPQNFHQMMTGLRQELIRKLNRINAG